MKLIMYYCLATRSSGLYVQNVMMSGSNRSMGTGSNRTRTKNTLKN